MSSKRLALLLFILCVILSFQSCKLWKDCCPEYSTSPKDTFGKNTHTDGSAWAETDVIIDSDKTGVRILADKVEFKSVVKKGGDDDAKNVKIIIQLPTESLIRSFKASKEKKNLKCYQCDNVVICQDEGGLGRGQVIDVKVIADKPRYGIDKCSFGIFAYPKSPADVKPENNHFGWSGSCN